MSPETVNHAQYRPGQSRGHYESYFQRANHPELPLAFWIRYTVFSPEKQPGKAIGELWATWFDGRSGGHHVSVKNEHPIADCRFATDRFDVAVGESRLGDGHLKGRAETGANAIAWDLKFEGHEPPLFLLPRKLYRTALPKAKSLVPAPNSRYNGIIRVNGEEKAIQDWIGSQNHNWGTKHTDHYAWGQVAGFDNEPDSFLEIGTARLKFGPVWTPFMTVAVLRLRGKEYCINTIRQSLAAKAGFTYFDWHFDTVSDDVRIHGNISAPADAFVGLPYYNPPGGIKHCLNTKIAACRLNVHFRKEDKTEILETGSRAAFEILTDDRNHGIPIYV